MLKNLSEAQHGIWKDVDFCALKIDNGFVTNQWQLFPWMICPKNFVHFVNLFLFAHQFFWDVERFLQGEICGILDGILITKEILSHECRRIHRRSHEHSPNYWMLFSRICNVRHSFLSVSHLVFDFVHEILLRHCPWRNFRNLPLLVSLHYQVAPIHHELSLRTLRFVHFRREEVLHDEGEFVAPHSKKFYLVSLIDRAP